MKNIGLDVMCNIWKDTFAALLIFAFSKRSKANEIWIQEISRTVRLAVVESCKREIINENIEHSKL